jgi:integrase
MAHLYKPTIIRYRLPDGKAVPKETPGARKSRERAKKWYGKFRDHLDRVKSVALCADKAAAATMLNELTIKSDRRRSGRVDEFDDHAKRPLVGHLDDFERYLTDKGSTAEHVKRTRKRIDAVLTGCGFERVSDLSAPSVQTYLADMQTKGYGIASANHYLRAVKGFSRWLSRHRRTMADALAALSIQNERTDIRRERRALEADEFARLVRAARTGESYRGLTGETRELIYLLAANTGLRANEIASLTAASFDLDGDPPTVTVTAAYSKRRRRDVLPLRRDLADRLCLVVSASAANGGAVRMARKRAPGNSGDQTSPADARAGRVWPGTWHERAAEMLRADLEAARGAWLGERQEEGERRERENSDFLRHEDAAGRVVDFHALRHHFISSLARAGVHPKDAQALARHSTITLTMDRYSHVTVCDMSAALDRLPELPGAEPTADALAMRATGTDGRSDRDTRAATDSSGTENPVALPVALNVALSAVPPCSELSQTDREASGPAHAKTPVFPASFGVFRGENEDRPGGIRTPDQGIMSPLL